jgi:hypothetical protein
MPMGPRYSWLYLFKDLLVEEAMNYNFLYTSKGGSEKSVIVLTLTLCDDNLVGILGCGVR